MTDADIETFHDSLTRCLATPGFLKSFYDRFIGSSPEVAARFRNTDFVKQQRILQASLHMMILAAHGAPEAQTHLQRLAARHGKGQLNIPPPMYQLWLECLLQTVRECDPSFTPSLEPVWRAMLTPGIEQMIAEYEGPAGVG